MNKELINCFDKKKSLEKELGRLCSLIENSENFTMVTNILEQLEKTNTDISSSVFDTILDKSKEELFNFNTQTGLSLSEKKEMAQLILLEEDNLTTCVYMVYDHATKLTKIGVTSDLKQRMSSMYYGKDITGRDLTLFYVCPIVRRLKYKCEQVFHDYYSDFRVYGEWFNLGNPFEEDNNIHSVDSIIKLNYTTVENFYPEFEVDDLNIFHYDSYEIDDLLGLQGCCVENPFGGVFGDKTNSTPTLLKSNHTFKNINVFILDFFKRNKDVSIETSSGSRVFLSEYGGCISKTLSISNDVKCVKFFDNFDYWESTILYIQKLFSDI